VTLHFKPNSITLASSELASNMFEAGSCLIPLHYSWSEQPPNQIRTGSEPAPNKLV